MPTPPITRPGTKDSPVSFRSRLSKWSGLVASIFASTFRGATRTLASPGVLISLMVVLGASVIGWAVFVFGKYCGGGDRSASGWCGVISNSPPWVLVSGLATVPAVILTWYWREKHKRQDIEIAQNGQVTDRFTRAVEQLGSSESAVRLGAIYGLERIMKDSVRDHWTIVEILSAFVRLSSPVDEHDVSEPVAPHVRPPIDVQAALTVIGRRIVAHDPKNAHVDLNRTNLRGADLIGASLAGVFLRSSDLRRVLLRDADLRGAYLQEAVMTRARLVRANLEGAHAACAKLKSANLWRANMRNADFSECIFHEARLHGAVLDGTNLQSSELASAVGLTRKRISSAKLDANTTLPTAHMDLLPDREEEPYESPDGES